jgi:hypothetical protein
MGWIARGKLHRGSTRCFSLEARRNEIEAVLPELDTAELST